MQETITCYKNVRLLRNHQIVEDTLWTGGTKIIPEQLVADIEVDCGGKILAPGFIDIQINGAFGIDFTNEADEVGRAAEKLTQFGVTSFLPTVVTSKPDTYKRALPHLQPRAVTHGAEILGIHLEGPFINPEKHGAHPADVCQGCPRTLEEIEAVYGPLFGVKIVTLAPELPGALETIQVLDHHLITVAGGHTNATQEQAQEAIEAGMRLVTHLFNAMPGFHHREPGIVGEALQNPHLWYSMISDGIHLDDQAVQMAWKMNPQRLILVSDGMAAMGLEPGEYPLGGKRVRVDAVKATVVETDTLAGSICPLNEAMLKFKRSTGCSDVEALEAVSLHPAQLLRLEGKKGTLSVGADADFVLLDEVLHVQATYVGGRLAWERS